MAHAAACLPTVVAKPDIFFHLTAFLRTEDTARLGATCTSARDAAAADRVWRRACVRDWALHPTGADGCRAQWRSEFKRVGARAYPCMPRVRRVWERITAWASVHFPQALPLGSPLTSEEINVMEHELGCPFPAPVRASLCIHDGCQYKNRFRQLHTILGCAMAYGELQGSYLMPMRQFVPGSSLVRTSGVIPESFEAWHVPIAVGGASIWLCMHTGKLTTVLRGPEVVPAAGPPDALERADPLRPREPVHVADPAHAYALTHAEAEHLQEHVRDGESAWRPGAPACCFCGSGAYNDPSTRPSTEPPDPWCFIRWLEVLAARMETGYVEVTSVPEEMVPEGMDPAQLRYINKFPRFGRSTSLAVTRGVHIRMSPVFMPEQGVITLLKESDTLDSRQRPRGQNSLMWMYQASMWLGPPSSEERAAGVRQLASAQLVSRRWRIHDHGQAAEGAEDETVQGEGVIGLYPLLRADAPEPPFQYASRTGCNWGVCVRGAAVGGWMEGGLTFTPGTNHVPAGDAFEARVARWPLWVPEFIY